MATLRSCLIYLSIPIPIHIPFESLELFSKVDNSSWAFYWKRWGKLQIAHSTNAHSHTHLRTHIYKHFYIFKTPSKVESNVCHIYSLRISFSSFNLFDVFLFRFQLCAFVFNSCKRNKRRKKNCNKYTCKRNRFLHFLTCEGKLLWDGETDIRCIVLSILFSFYIICLFSRSFVRLFSCLFICLFVRICIPMNSFWSKIL